MDIRVPWTSLGGPMPNGDAEVADAVLASPSVDDAVSTRPMVAELLAQHFARVWRVARRMGLESALAEEAAQEAFIILFQRSEDVRPGRELAFLMTTVTNISRNLRRRSHLQREVSGHESFEHHATHMTPHGLCEQKQAKELVDDILTCLSESVRLVFVLYEIEQLTLQQIADLLEIPMGTAGSRLRLGRQAFRKELMRRTKLGLVAGEEP